ncbi:MAG: hypothetical protein ACI8P3_002351, partial [Saprospiraceae bacterium]
PSILKQFNRPKRVFIKQQTKPLSIIGLLFLQL